MNKLFFKVNHILKIYFGRVYCLNYFAITFFLSEANIEVLICEKLSSGGDASLIVERFEISCNSGVVLQAISGSPETTDLFSCIRILRVRKISLQSMCGGVDSVIINIQLILSIWLGTNMITLTGFYCTTIWGKVILNNVITAFIVSYFH